MADKWTEVTVTNGKGRRVTTVGSFDPAKAHKKADEQIKRGYTKTEKTR